MTTSRPRRWHRAVARTSSDPTAVPGVLSTACALKAKAMHKAGLFQSWQRPLDRPHLFRLQPALALGHGEKDLLAVGQALEARELTLTCRCHNGLNVLHMLEGLHLFKP